MQTSQDTQTGEWRQFRAHGNLLNTIIKRQEGSLHKAVCEAVQNAIDAKATEVNITLDNNQLVISDNGNGFGSKEDVHQYFEVFGAPHDECEEKVFGQFRMGRGQLFLFGINTWSSGTSVMVVDLDKGLGYNYREVTADKEVKGCNIEVVFTAPAMVSHTLSQLKINLFWASIQVYLNGVLVSHPVESVVWDVNTPEGYAIITGNEEKRIYDRGFLVVNERTSPGQGVVVVSKQPLTLNFARNAVQYNCPVMEKLNAAITNCLASREKARKGVLKKLSADSTKLREPFLPKGMTLQDVVERGRMFGADMVAGLPVAQDINGKYWTINSLNDGLTHYSCYIVCVPAGVTEEKIAEIQIASKAGFGLYFDEASYKIIQEFSGKVYSKCMVDDFTTINGLSFLEFVKGAPTGELETKKRSTKLKALVLDLKKRFRKLESLCFANMHYSFEAIGKVTVLTHIGGPEFFSSDKWTVSIRSDAENWMSSQKLFELFYCWAVTASISFSHSSSQFRLEDIEERNLDARHIRPVNSLLRYFSRFVSTKSTEKNDD